MYTGRGVNLDKKGNSQRLYFLKINFKNSFLVFHLFVNIILNINWMPLKEMLTKYTKVVNIGPFCTSS